MLHVKTTNRFRKDFKLAERRGKGMEKLRRVIKSLVRQEQQKLLIEFHDHSLKGSYQGFRECHVEPNWLLIYSVQDSDLVLARTGTHSDLFE